MTESHEAWTDWHAKWGQIKNLRAAVAALHAKLLAAENRAELWERTARRLERELAAGRGEP